MSGFVLLTVPARDIPDGRHENRLFIAARGSGSLSVPHFIPIGIKTYIMKPQEILYKTILFFLTMIINLLIRLAECFNISAGWILT